MATLQKDLTVGQPELVGDITLCFFFGHQKLWILNTSVKSDDRVPTLINFRWSDYLNVPLRFYKTLVSITKAYHGLCKFPPLLLLQDNWLELVLPRSLETRACRISCN